MLTNLKSITVAKILMQNNHCELRVISHLDSKKDFTLQAICNDHVAVSIPIRFRTVAAASSCLAAASLSGHFIPVAGTCSVCR